VFVTDFAHTNILPGHLTDRFRRVGQEVKHPVSPNAKLTDDEERAKDNRIGTCG
jgi:hypothetical protein